MKIFQIRYHKALFPIYKLRCCKCHSKGVEFSPCRMSCYNLKCTCFAFFLQVCTIIIEILNLLHLTVPHSMYTRCGPKRQTLIMRL